jgi:hypothetical protein
MVLFCQDDAAEIVEAAPAVSALVLLAKGIGILVPIFYNTIGGAFWATNALWPPLFSKKIEALLRGNKIVNADIQSLCGSVIIVPLLSGLREARMIILKPLESPAFSLRVQHPRAAPGNTV